MAATIPLEPNLNSEAFFDPNSTKSNKKAEEAKEDIDNFIDMVENQTQLNGKILNILQSEQLNKEEQQQLVSMLTQNATNAAFVQTLMKNRNMEILEDTPIENIIPEVTQEVGTIDKFKNMFASFKASILPNMFFRNPKNQNWRETGEILQVPIQPKLQSNPTILNLISFIGEKASEANVFLKKTSTDLYLIGQKRKIKKLHKKYESIFNTLKIDSDNFLEKKSTNNFSETEIVSFIQKTLEVKLGLEMESSSKQYNFSILKGLTQELKFDMLQNIISKEVNKTISNVMDINNTLENEKNNNKFMKMVIEFSREYKLNPDLVIHSLKENPEILSDYPKFDKLLKNKVDIINANENYIGLIKNNVMYLNELIKVQDAVVNEVNKLEITPEKKESFEKQINSNSVYKNEVVNINFAQMKKNILSIMSEQEYLKNESNLKVA